MLIIKIKNIIRKYYYKNIIKKHYYEPYFIKWYEFIVPSIWRSGSTLICNLISKWSKRPIKFLRDLSKLSKIDKDIYVLKTHSPLKEKLNYNYKAIFIYWNIENAIASIYNIKNINNHLINLWVNFRNRLLFNIKKIFDKDDAYIFLIKWDKLNFKKNIKSWKKDKNTLFIKFEELLKNKKKKLKEISNFLWISIPDFDIKKRKTSSKDLPKRIIKQINKEYYKWKI